MTETSCPCFIIIIVVVLFFLFSILSHLQLLFLFYPELANNKRKIDKLCNGTDFTTFLDETYKKKESVQKRKGYLSAAKIVFENLASKFESEKSCPVCQTSFSNNTSALPAIIEELKHRVVLVPGQLAQTENEFKKVEVLYNNLQQLKIVNDDIATMSKTKIPKLEQEISNLTEQHEETNMVITGKRYIFRECHTNWY